MRINELRKTDFREFIADMIENNGLEWALNRVYENSTLSESIRFSCTKRGHQYWNNINQNGYQVEMTIKQIEEKLNLSTNTLKVIPF